MKKIIKYFITLKILKMEKIQITGEEKAQAFHEQTSRTDKLILKTNLSLGLTIRQHFAGQALQGLCANENLFTAFKNVLD